MSRTHTFHGAIGIPLSEVEGAADERKGPKGIPAAPNQVLRDYLAQRTAVCRKLARSAESTDRQAALAQGGLNELEGVEALIAEQEK